MTNNIKNQSEALKRVLKLTKGPAGLARLLGYNLSTVRNWPSRGRVPASEAVNVSNATKGEVSVMALLGYESVDGESNDSASRSSNVA